MKYTIFPYRLQYRFPFTIAHSSRTYTPNVYLLLQFKNYSAWGEAAFPPYVSETATTLAALVRKMKWPEDLAQLDIHDFISLLDRKHPGNSFALAAIDMALHNLQTQITGVPVSSRYAIPNISKDTSITLGISGEDEMAEKIKSTADAAYYKLKIDQDHVGLVVETYKRLSVKPFVVDANQGFQSMDTALQWCKKLHEMGCGYLEQPFHKSDFESHQWLKNKSPLPIIADESFQRLPDLENIKECFDGINVKLMKSSGIAEACRALKMAKESGLKTIIGCMSESSVAVGAAWQLAPLADWVDLDGPVLIKNDLFAPELGYSDEQVIERLGRFEV